MLEPPVNNQPIVSSSND